MHWLKRTVGMIQHDYFPQQPLSDVLQVDSEKHIQELTSLKETSIMS